MLVTRPASADIWNGPYVKGGRVPMDPWGHAYQYHIVTDHTPPYEITTLGPDGRGGGTSTASDVSNAGQ